jgi:hypothetical protein
MNILRRATLLASLMASNAGVSATEISGRYADGLQVVRKSDSHNTQQLICVAPAFDRAPWFMDHATDKQRQHETYVREVVVQNICPNSGPFSVGRKERPIGPSSAVMAPLP